MKLPILVKTVFQTLKLYHSSILMHCIIRGLISFNFLLYYLLNHCNLIQYSFRQFYQIFFFILCKLTPASIQHFTVNAIAAYCIYTKNYPLVRDGNCAMIYLTLFRATMNNSGQIWAYFGASHYSYLFIQTRPGQSEHGGVSQSACLTV